ncbi:SIR2-domain-containing protein [Mycena pura]|uniref:SIR2-domain-containing protein n=1 Tax=Mycena pura TaxID=153505 RepID=A0AAD6YN43_9AGAR|nr:SIR2-domain-containing protein [Mycena pura]
MSSPKPQHQGHSPLSTGSSSPEAVKFTIQQLTSSQIRALLAYSEDVDMEPETAEELVQALIQTTNSGAEDGSSGLQVVQDSDGLDVQVSDLDMAALYHVPEDVQPWSPQQIRGMMHHLKEHGASSWMAEYVLKRDIPIPRLLLAFGINLSPPLHSMSLVTLSYVLRVAMSRELQLREKLPNHNTVDDAVRLIRDSHRILILTGAGISVSCGIPDFRSRDGLYATLRQRGDYDLEDPQQMFDINYFRENPAGDQIYPSNFVPSPCHRFIKLVEDKNQNYTQNIDTLETLAGVSRVLQCHGSFATASCLLCRRQVLGSEIEADILAQKVPLCSVCNAPQPGTVNGKPKSKKKKKAKDVWDSEDEDESDGPTYPLGIMKPDITFFGEKLTDHFDHSLAADRNEVDLLLVIGTSLKVAPVADILCALKISILINKTAVRHINPDIILLGNADDIVMHLCAKLGWELPPEGSVTSKPVLENVKKRSAADLHALEEPRHALRSKSKQLIPAHSHIWVFEGAEGGDWLMQIEEQLASPRGRKSELQSESDIHLDIEHQSPKKPRLE